MLFLSIMESMIAAQTTQLKRFLTHYIDTLNFHDDYAFVKNHSAYHRVASLFGNGGHQQRTADKQYLPKEFFWGLLQGNPEPFFKKVRMSKAKNPSERTIEL